MRSSWRDLTSPHAPFARVLVHPPPTTVKRIALSICCLTQALQHLIMTVPTGQVQVAAMQAPALKHTRGAHSQSECIPGF